MLDKIFQAARAFLLTEFGEDFFTQNEGGVFENFEPQKAKFALARFLVYYFREEELVSIITVDGKELWQNKGSKDALTVQVTLDNGANHFSLCIEIFPRDNEYIEELREIFWGEFFLGQGLSLTPSTYVKEIEENPLSNWPQGFRAHPVHQIWN